MGLLDIFYSEANRWRDKSISKKEKKEAIKQALLKTLTKFQFIWDDQIMSNDYRGERLQNLLRDFSEDFMNIAVEIDMVLNETEIVEHLRAISTDFLRDVNKPRTFSYEEIISKNMGESISRINSIKQKLQE